MHQLTGYLQSNFGLCCSFKEHFLSFQNEALQLCIKINTAIDRVDYMFTSEFEAEVEETEKATLQQYYREAMIQGYNFAFEVWTWWDSVYMNAAHYEIKIAPQLANSNPNDPINSRWTNQVLPYIFRHFAICHNSEKKECHFWLMPTLSSLLIYHILKIAILSQDNLKMCHCFRSLVFYGCWKELVMIWWSLVVERPCGFPAPLNI